MQRRNLYEILSHRFHKGKTLVITGPRQVGKTTLMNELIRNYSGQSTYINCEIPANKELFSTISIEHFKTIIGGNTLMILDEAQQIENIGLCLKILHDHFGKEVQFVATGSSALDIADKIFEPLTGRHFLYHLYPMCLNEVYNDNQYSSLINNLSWHLVYGMYPDTINFKEDAQQYILSLANQYLYKDVLAWKDIRKPDLLDKILKLLAYQIGQEVNLHELSKQLGVSSETVDNYLLLLEKSFVIYRLSSFGNNKRKEISKMKKIFFWDNGIRNALIGNFSPMNSRPDAGALWENFIITERIKMNHYGASRAEEYFWRSYNQQEVDYIELQGENLLACEIKWALHKKHRITKGFTNLYPQAKTAIITPKNFLSFAKGENVGE